MKSSPRLISFAASLIMLSAGLWLANAQQRVIAYWPFDSMKGDTFKDNTGNGYNAIWSGSGVGLAPGIKGNALSCPNSGFDIQISNSKDSFCLSRFTIEGWIYLNTNEGTATQQKILDFSCVQTGQRNGWTSDISSVAGFSMSSGNGSAWEVTTGTTVFQANTWYHFACSYDSSMLRVYVNGLLEGSSAYQGTYPASGINARIGCQKRADSSLDFFLNGRLDELKLYNYALPADSILAHYKLYTPPPLLVSPANGAVNQLIAPTLTWGSVNGASYNLQVSTSSVFSAIMISQTGLAAVSSGVTGLAANTTYYWRVNAASATITSAWTGAWSFTTAPPIPGIPVLSSPANGTSNQPLSLNFIWGTAAGAASYAIQVSTSSSFASTSAYQSGLTTTNASVSGLSANSTYYWHVNATNGGGTSAWSTTWSFAAILVAPSVPTLLSPATGTAGQPIASSLYWNVASGAATYSLQVSTSPAFSTTVVFQSGTTATSAAISGLANSVTYYWHVNASGIGGTSAWSGAWSFTTAAPPIPSIPGLSSPANGANSQPVAATFYWGAATGAASYGLQISTVSTFAATVTSLTGLTGTSAGIGDLNNNTVYYWRVDATNGGGSSAWAGAWSFVTVVFPGQMALLSPANGSIFVKNTPLTLSWTTIPSITSCTVQVSTSPSFSTTVLLQSGLTTAAPFTPTHGVQYYWEVSASNGSGTGPWSAIWSMTPSISVLAPLRRDGNTEFSVHQGVVAYSLQVPDRVELAVYDVSGRTVQDVKRIQSAGRYSVDLKSSCLAAGLYIVQFKATGFDRIASMLISR